MQLRGRKPFSCRQQSDLQEATRRNRKQGEGGALREKREGTGGVNREETRKTEERGKEGETMKRKKRVGTNARMEALDKREG